MVKTLHGRKPGRRHARIVKKLRHRRRMEARRVAAEDAECHTSCTITSSSSYGTTTGQLPSPFLARQLVEYPLTESSSTTSVSTPATVSTASTASLSLIERAHEMEYLPLPQRRLYFTPSEVNALLSFDEDDAKDAVVEKVSDAPVAEDKQMVLYKARAARGRKARGVSESINVSGGFAGRSIDRTVVSESDLHPTAIPMPPPPHSAPAAVAASTTVAAPVAADDLPDIEEDHPSDPIIAAPPPSSHHAVSPNVAPHPVVGNSSNDQPMIIYTTICLSCGGKAITRGHLVAAGGNIGNHVSESNFHPTAVTVAAPSAAPQDAAPAATGHQGHFLIDHPTATVLPHHAAADHHDDHNRQQLPDEVTDRYLSHLFTPSIANLTTAAVDELSHHENTTTTRTDDYHHFRGIFSTDHHPSHHSFARQPSTSTSDATSWGLNALYRHNNDRTANGISANGMDEYTSQNDTATDDYRHFRNIFSTEHHPHHSAAAPRSEATTWGLNTLFNGRTRHPSVGTLSAIWEELTTTSDTSSDDFRRLRNLFSSDSQHTAPATATTTAPPPRQQQHTNVSSDETSMGLNALFNNNDRTVRQVSSHDNDTSLGLRTLFDEKSNHG